jgi:hypothetical protein
MPTPAHVIAVDFKTGFVFTDDSRSLPITAWIDEFGDRTGDFDEAVRFVATAGPEVFVGNVGDWAPRVIN